MRLLAISTLILKLVAMRRLFSHDTVVPLSRHLGGRWKSEAGTGRGSLSTCCREAGKGNGGRERGLWKWNFRHGRSDDDACGFGGIVSTTTL
jgi:hypothetical protein